MVKAARPEDVEQGLDVLRNVYGTRRNSSSAVMKSQYGEEPFHAYFTVYKERVSR